MLRTNKARREIINLARRILLQLPLTRLRVLHILPQAPHTPLIINSLLMVAQVPMIKVLLPLAQVIGNKDLHLQDFRVVRRNSHLMAINTNPVKISIRLNRLTTEAEEVDIPALAMVVDVK